MQAEVVAGRILEVLTHADALPVFDDGLQHLLHGDSKRALAPQRHASNTTLARA